MLAWFLLVLQLSFLVANGQLNETSTTSTPTTTIYSTVFHTTTVGNYFIDIQVIITLQCANNSIASMECADLAEIKGLFIELLQNLQELLNLNEMISIVYDSVHASIAIINTNADVYDGEIMINSTIRTNNMEDFETLIVYIPTDFAAALESDMETELEGIDSASIDVESTITGSGEIDGDGDDDDKAWHEKWVDPQNYGVFEWVVVSLILFFLILCIAGGSWWCCRRRRKKDGVDFMHNPHRYDSEFPGHREMQTFSTVNGYTKPRVNYVE